MNPFKRYKTTLIYLVFCFFGFGANAQIFQGQVVDSDTKSPLEFVQIGVQNKNIGILSDEKGQFQLDQNKFLATDSLQFFYLGYEQRTLLVQDLLSSPNSEVKLQKRVFSLPKIDIKAEALTKDKKLGYSKKGLARTGWYGFERNIINNPVGERGSIIELKGKTAFLKSVNFFMLDNAFDSLVFRIHLYSIKDGLPDKELLPENVFVKITQKKGWITVPIDHLQLITNKDLLATIEWVKAWKSAKLKKEEGLHFSLGFKGKLFHREFAHQANWKINEKFHLKIYLDAKTN